MPNAVLTDFPSGSDNQGWPVEPEGMLMPGRVQAWPAGTQRAANSATRLLSQAVAWWDVEQYRDRDRFLRNRGTGGELLDLRLGSDIAPNSNDPLYLAPEDQGYVYLPGVNSNWMSVPDEAALDITGDIDIRIRVALDDWTPSTVVRLVSKYSFGGTRSYMLDLQTSGVIRLTWSADGTATNTIASTVATGIPDGEVKWVRGTLDANNGSSGNNIKFYLSDDGVTWTQLGATITTAGIASIFNSTSSLGVGSDSLGNGTAAGRYYQVVIYSDLTETNKVLDIDCDAITSGSSTSFTAVTGQTVTINRSTAGRKSVAVPSRHKGGKPVMLLGTDDYLEVQDSWQHGLLNFGQGDSFTVLAILRTWNTPTSSEVMIGKHSNVTPFDGWALRYFSTTLSPQMFMADAANSAAFYAPTQVAGATTTNVMAVTGRSAWTVYSNSSSATARNISAVTGTLGSNYALRIGRISSGSQYLNAEFYAAAIFRRALSAAEITTISNYFTGRIA